MHNKKIVINGVPFDLVNYFIRPDNVDALEFTVMNTTIEDLENAIRSGSGDIRIEGSFIGTRFTVLEMITKLYGNSLQYKAIVKKPSIEETVKQHVEDIIAMNDAIIELAEIIGGGE